MDKSVLLYCFSATGNSKRLAEVAASRFEEAGLVVKGVGQKSVAKRRRAERPLAVLRQLASLVRLELTTHCLEGSCSVLLSYRDVSAPILAPPRAI